MGAENGVQGPGARASEGSPERILGCRLSRRGFWGRWGRWH